MAVSDVLSKKVSINKTALTRWIIFEFEFNVKCTNSQMSLSVDKKVKTKLTQ